MHPHLLLTSFSEVPLLHDPLVWSKAGVSGGDPSFVFVECARERSKFMITRSAGGENYYYYQITSSFYLPKQHTII